MNMQRRLRQITTVSSLVSLASGFFLLGILILSNRNTEAAPIPGGVIGILLGAGFLMLAFSYWRYQSPKLR
jgi:hypothetical protein